MIINIKDKEYEVRFGVGFVRSLDAKYFTKGVGGAVFGMGLQVCVPKILTGDATALADLLYEGMAHLKSRPSIKDIDAYIDEIEDIDALFDEVLDELKKQNATRKPVEKMLENLGQAEKEND